MFRIVTKFSFEYLNIRCAQDFFFPLTRTYEFVTQGTHQETHSDGTSYANNVGGPNILFGKAKVVTDLREKGCNGEPNEESNKKAPPRTVEGAHVRPGKRAKLDLRRLVILVRVGADVVLRILLPLGL